ncbi:large ribosomal subunit protein mL46-like isoform X2 [Artemia franciscana]
MRLSSFASTQTAKEKWDLLSAVCLERKPVIARNLLPIEKEVLSMAQKMEYRLSLKSDHEIQLEKDRQRQERIKQGDADDSDMDQASLNSAQDFEDASVEELSKFPFADRITEADKEKDQKSLDRMLDRHLLLVVRQKLGTSSVWILPQGQRQEGETMRQAAERVLAESFDGKVQSRFLGNAPCGFYKYKYPKHIREQDGNSIGAKVFFFKAHVTSDSPLKKGSCIEDFAWLGRDELDSYLPEKYRKSVTEFLIDED